jgi:hypothetical protein
MIVEDYEAPTQKALTKVVHKLDVANLDGLLLAERQGEPVELAKRRVRRREGTSSLPFHKLPWLDGGMHATPQTFAVMVQVFLGLEDVLCLGNLFAKAPLGDPTRAMCPGPVGAPTPLLGHACLSCKSYGQAIRAHNCLCSVLARGFRQVGGQDRVLEDITTRVPLNDVRRGKEGQIVRPGDIVRVGVPLDDAEYASGRAPVKATHFIDLVITDVLTRTSLKDATVRASLAASESVKARECGESVRCAGFVHHPLAFSSRGAASEAAHKYLKKALSGSPDALHNVLCGAAFMVTLFVAETVLAHARGKLSPSLSALGWI